MTLTSKFKHYLSHSYPFYYSNRNRVLLGLLLIFILSVLFSYSFEPFEVNRSEHRFNYFWICIIHSLNPVLFGIFYFGMVSKYYGKEENWTIGKEAITLIVYIFCIGVLSFLVRDIVYIKADNWSMRYLWEEIRNTFLVGTLLISIILPMNFEYLFRKYTSSAKQISMNTNFKESDHARVTLNTEFIQDQISFDIQDFIYAKVDGNYTFIFIKTNTNVDSHLIRIPLIDLENQLRFSKTIIRTHRSYLVNIQFIEAIKGNAQGYQLNLAHIKEAIPVSRSNISNFKTKLQSQ